jgi:hypothetical protein
MSSPEAAPPPAAEGLSPASGPPPRLPPSTPPTCWSSWPGAPRQPMELRADPWSSVARLRLSRRQCRPRTRQTAVVVVLHLLADPCGHRRGGSGGRRAGGGHLDVRSPPLQHCKGGAPPPIPSLLILPSGSSNPATSTVGSSPCSRISASVRGIRGAAHPARRALEQGAVRPLPVCAREKRGGSSRGRGGWVGREIRLTSGSRRRVFGMKWRYKGRWMREM